MCDKPVKTGSTMVPSAIRSYLETRGQTADRCKKDECSDMARDLRRETEAVRIDRALVGRGRAFGMLAEARVFRGDIGSGPAGKMGVCVFV